MKHAAINVDADNVLSTSHLVIYGSFLEEQSFPDILIKAMCLGKTVVAPDLSMISKYVRFILLSLITKMSHHLLIYRYINVNFVNNFFSLLGSCDFTKNYSLL